MIKDGIQLLLRLGGWLENWRVMLISTQIVVKVEVEVDIGNILIFYGHNSFHKMLGFHSFVVFQIQSLN